MPTYGYVSRSVLLSLLVFSTMSILTDSGSVKWQVAENSVSNRQADSIKYPVWLTSVSQALKFLPCEIKTPVVLPYTATAREAHRMQSM